MIIDEVQEEIADLVRVVVPRSYAFAEGIISPPAAIVMLPDEYVFDRTFGRGMDSMTMDLLVMVGKADARSSHKLVSQYASGSGLKSVKAALEHPEEQYRTFDSVTVTAVEFEVYTNNAIDYLAAVFRLSVTGQGAPS